MEPQLRGGDAVRAGPQARGRCGPPPAHLTEILRVVLGGHKYHCLVLGPHQAAQQVEQHSSLGILPHEEEGGLQGEGSLGWLTGSRPWAGKGHGWSLTLSCSLSLESTSSRMSTGSMRPEVGKRGGWEGESLRDKPLPGADTRPSPRPHSCGSLTSPGELHQQLGQRGREQDSLVAPREAGNDFLQLLCKPHFKEPGRAEGSTGSGEGLPFQ